MIYIDKFAYISALKDTKPELKVLFGIATLIACIGSNNFISFGIVFISMFLAVVVLAKIPIGYYAKLLLLPFGFLVLGVLGIILNVSKEVSNPLWSVKLGEYYLFFTQSGLELAARLVCKSLAAVSCLYFIILTTPIRDIINLLKYLKCPETLVSLITLMYRFIFLLMEISLTKIKSQQCRHGYEKMRGFTKTFGMLWASVFIQSFRSGEWINKAMLLRGHDGNMKFIKKKITISIKEQVLVMCFVFLIILPNFFL